jgi:hypothetical protein
MKKAVHLLIFLLCSYLANAQNTAILEEQWWQPNREVNVVVRNDKTVYLGGNFNYIGPDEHFGAGISANTGTPDFTYLNPNSEVSATIPDGTGGWCIGGNFTYVGGQSRKHLARLNQQSSAAGEHQRFCLSNANKYQRTE